MSAWEETRPRGERGEAGGPPPEGLGALDDLPQLGAAWVLYEVGRAWIDAVRRRHGVVVAIGSGATESGMLPFVRDLVACGAVSAVALPVEVALADLGVALTDDSPHGGRSRAAANEIARLVNGAIAESPDRGAGESLFTLLAEASRVSRSLLGAAQAADVPVTVHGTVGGERYQQHADFDAAATAAALARDAMRLNEIVRRLGEKGLLVLVGGDAMLAQMIARAAERARAQSQLTTGLSTVALGRAPIAGAAVLEQIATAQHGRHLLVDAPEEIAFALLARAVEEVFKSGGRPAAEGPISASGISAFLKTAAPKPASTKRSATAPAHPAAAAASESVVASVELSEEQIEESRRRFRLGKSLASRGQADEAVVALQQAVQIDTRLIDAHKLLGDLLRQRDDFRGAIEHHQRVLDADPNSAQALTALAADFIAVREYGRAVAMCKRALALEPDNVDTIFYLGLAHFHQARSDWALDHLQRVVSARPTWSPGLYYLGLVLEQGHHFKDALPRLRAAVEHAENDGQKGRALRAITEVGVRAGDYAMARQACEEALRLTPDDEDLKRRFQEISKHADRVNWA